MPGEGGWGGRARCTGQVCAALGLKLQDGSVVAVSGESEDGYD